MKTIFGFVGCGNMGSAIAKAVNRSELEKDILIADNSEEKVKELKNEIFAIPTNNNEIALRANVIFLGVKPQVIERVISSISKDIEGRQDVLVVSMAAGVAINQLEEYFGYSLPIIRIMPNTPVSVGEGMVLYTPNNKVTEEQEALFLKSMYYSGVIDKIEEGQIDAASALSGCGPAFVYMFIEALADGAVSCGLPRDKAIKYASQTLIGSASLVLCADKHPEELKDAVCSPGGSTIMGVKALENGKMRGTVINAVSESFKRTKELGKK